MSDARSTEKRRKQSLHSRAWSHATKHKADAPSTWDEGERGSYWWALYEGYKAGIASARRERKKP